MLRIIKKRYDIATESTNSQRALRSGDVELDNVIADAQSDHQQRVVGKS